MNCQIMDKIKKMISDLLQKQLSKKIRKTRKANFGGQDDLLGSPKMSKWPPIKLSSLAI